MSILKDCIQKLADELSKDNLAIGSLDRFRAGQMDFEKWGSGVIIGSAPWILQRLEAHMARLGLVSFEWSAATNYPFQNSDLEGFCFRIQGMIPKEGALAGFYIGRVGPQTYALFGLRINLDEAEPIKESSSPYSALRQESDTTTASDPTSAESDPGEIAGEARTPSYPHQNQTNRDPSLFVLPLHKGEVSYTPPSSCVICGAPDTTSARWRLLSTLGTNIAQDQRKSASEPTPAIVIPVSLCRVHRGIRNPHLFIGNVRGILPVIVGTGSALMATVGAYFLTCAESAEDKQFLLTATIVSVALAIGCWLLFRWEVHRRNGLAISLVAIAKDTASLKIDGVHRAFLDAIRKISIVSAPDLSVSFAASHSRTELTPPMPGGDAQTHEEAIDHASSASHRNVEAPEPLSKVGSVPNRQITLPPPKFMRFASACIYIIGGLTSVLVIGGFLIYHQRRSMKGWVKSASWIETALGSMLAIMVFLPMLVRFDIGGIDAALSPPMTHVFVLGFFGVVCFAARTWREMLTRESVQQQA